MIPVRVFVCLPRHLDAAAWQQRFENGEVADRTPYGYHLAERHGAEVHFSSPTRPWPGPLGLLDRALRKWMGFDLRHVWRQRQALSRGGYDVIWTHTEWEHLALSACAWLGLRLPPVLAQSVWACDDWQRQWWWRRALVKALWSRAALAVLNSPLNADFAREQIGLTRVRFIHFGISLDSYPLQPPRVRADLERPLRLLALGNDKHRDWATLADAFADRHNVELRIGSATFPRGRVTSNMRLSVMSQAEVRAAYAWCDAVVIPVVHNLHASGLTAVLEAVASGVPVIVTATGGLGDYFPEFALRYVPTGDAPAWQKAADAIAADPTGAAAMAMRAQAVLKEKALSTEGYAARNLALSRELLCPPAAAGNS
jgi:glycosyltransferase involved in cell wall biosynthesis